MIYDVIIIGCGSAGVSAAITCLKKGLKILVITKKENYSHIHPSQSVHPGLLTLMEGLNLENVLLNSVKSSYTGIYVNEQFVALGKDQQHWKGYHIDKSLFNLLLFEKLKKLEIPFINENVNHIKFSLNKEIVSITTKDTSIYKSKFIIDASGSKRKFGRLLKLEEFFFSPPLICRTGISELVKDHKLRTEFISQKNGWIWIAPENESQFTWSKLSLNKKDIYHSFINENKRISNIYTSNVRWRVFRPVYKDNIILSGDAAGILDPAAGQGIFNAILSGIKAGETVVESVKNPLLSKLFLLQYDQWFITNYEQKIEQLKNYYETLNIKFS